MLSTRESLIVCATGLVLATISWCWHASQGCTCPWCKRKFPRRIIFVRHGQSTGNVDPDSYRHTPDHAMHLTDLGKKQAQAAGESIKRIIGNETTRCIVSPYIRTIETFEEIMKAWGENAKQVPWIEEPRIREQDFGNFQDPEQIRDCKAQRHKFGGFFYRFPSGESPADVFDRISSFLETLHRMFARHRQENYILVTHGVTIRVLLMRYFKYTISHFERMLNFHNAEFVVLEHNGRGSFDIVKMVHPHIDPISSKVTIFESSTIRLREAIECRQSVLASSYEKDALF